MTFSDALPFQFWPSDCDTFNENQVDGINSTCYIHKAESGDQQKIQFYNTEGGATSLVITSETGAILYTETISPVLTGSIYLYNFDFTFDDLGINDQLVKVYIGGFVTIVDNDTNNSLGWTQTIESNKAVWRIGQYAIETKTYKSTNLAADIGIGTTTIIITVSEGTAGVIINLSKSSQSQSITTTLIPGDNFIEVTTTHLYNVIEITAILQSYNSILFTISDIRIISSSNELTIPNNTFTSSLSPWTNQSTNTRDLTWSYFSGIGVSGGSAKVSFTQETHANTIFSGTVATTSNITLSGHQTIDGVLTTTDMVVLVKNQTNKNQNGPYLAKSGAWESLIVPNLSSRQSITQLQNAIAHITSGTTQSNTYWRQQTKFTGNSVGSQDIVFYQYEANTYDRSMFLRGTLDSTITNGDLINVAFDLTVQNTLNPNIVIDIYVGGVKQALGSIIDYRATGLDIIFTSATTSTQFEIVARNVSSTVGTSTLVISKVNVYKVTEYTVPAFSLWSNTGYGITWSESAGSITAARPSASFSVYFYHVGLSNNIGRQISILTGESASFNFKIHSPTATPNIYYRISFQNIDCDEVQYFEGNITTQNDILEAGGTFIPNEDVVNVVIYTENLNSTEAYFVIDEIIIKKVGGSARTDFLNIKDSHEETVLIEYSNRRNYAGLIYQNVTPDPSFYIRVPATFFHERFPETDEIIELSSSIETLNSTLMAQKKLEVHHMPYYMHRKLKLVLKQSLTIENQQWVKQESYDIEEGNRKFPLKRASVYLTEKNYVQRNVI